MSAEADMARHDLSKRAVSGFSGTIICAFDKQIIDISLIELRSS